MSLLMNLFTQFPMLINASTGATDNGMVFIGIGLCALCMGCSGLGEGLVCAKTVEGMSRNPEMYGKLRTAMILGCALTETTAIYGLVVIILMLFVA